jgi:O-acetyl-ADP-ribose deacetylase (regulator of RNase III)/uncharacterized protein YwgA
MIDVIVGDVLASKAQTIVNTVNCVGIMGKGIALEFKRHFPAMFKDYQKRCTRDEVKLGQPYLFKSLTNDPWIINFPTKDHWRSVAKLDDIMKGMRYLLEHYKEWGITSLAVPPLGCGQGQLEWKIIGPTLYRYLKQFDIPVELYAPYGTPAAETQSNFLSQPSEPVIADVGYSPSKIKPDWIAIVEVLARIEKEQYHWPIGRTMFQKIAYFMTEEGLATDLIFAQGSYGPFSSNMKTKITQIVNNGLINEKHFGGMFLVSTGPTYHDARQAYKRAILEKERKIDRIVDLFLRMNTRQAEIAATVHFATKLLTSKYNRKPTENQVLTYVLEWKQRRKPPVSKLEIAQAIRNLAALKWIQVESSSDLPLPDDACLA